MSEEMGFDPEWCMDLVRAALAEDMGDGDVTSQAVVPADAVTSASLVANEEGVVAGLPAAAMVFAEVDASIVFQQLVTDGSRVSAGQRVAIVQGPARSVLAGERTALNFVQQLSGVATFVSRLVEIASPHGVTIKDTRKTIPGWRALQKYAVRAGGGENHRMGLYDNVLIKENHLSCLPGSRTEAIREAVTAAKKHCPDMKVEVEVEGLEEFSEACKAGADIIMLDNVSPDIIRDAAAMARELGDKRPLIEVSGNVTAKSIEEIAVLRPDWISVGKITHSAKALDLSMEFQE